MTSRNAYILRLWMPVCAWVLVMFFVSSLPGKDIPEVGIPFIDKVAHFGEFFILGIAMIRAMAGTSPNINLAKAVILSIIIISLYAAFDEWHQNFIPGRTCDLFDFLADAIGAAAGAIVYSLWRKIADSKTV